MAALNSIFPLEYVDKKCRAGWSASDGEAELYPGESYNVKVTGCDELTDADILAGMKDYLARMYRLRINAAKKDKKGSLGREWFDKIIEADQIEFSATDLIHHRPVVSVEASLSAIKSDKSMSKEDKLALIEKAIKDLKDLK